MYRLILLLLITVKFLFASEFIDLPLKEYIKIVAKQENISIVIDKNIDSNYSIFLSSNVKKNDYFEILETILMQNNMILKASNNHYFITKKTKKTSIKNALFSYKFKYLKGEDIEDIMKLYNYKFKYVKNLKSIFIDCSYKEFKELEVIFKNYDLLPFQKKLKITILDTNITKLKDYGFDNKLNIKSNSNTSFFFNLLAFPFTATNTLSNTNKTNFNTFIKFMNSKDLTTILSSPTITIFDNKKVFV